MPPFTRERQDEYGRAQRVPTSFGIVASLVGIVVAVVAFVLVLNWVTSFKGVDSGRVAVIKQGGPFDGRDISDARQPGSGLASIGIFNDQYELPVTQRDLTEEAGTIVVPTADAVNVVVDGQALLSLNPDRDTVINFYKKYGRRTWKGEDITSDKGWVNFLKIRAVPILYQSIRQTVGSYDCIQLNNVCTYVQNEDVDAAQDEAKKVNTEQNLAEAEQAISEAFQRNLRAGLGGEYFEGVRFQNLRVTFEPAVAEQVTEAQQKRAAVSSARLEADRRTTEAEGATRVANEQAKQIAAKARAYGRNPQQAEIDKIRALCGSGGCQRLQVLGGGDIISQLGAQDGK